MRGDMEMMWQAMKGSHYQRIVDQLAKTIRENDDFQKVISATLGTVIKAMHAETGTMWLYERFSSGRIHPKAVYGGADLSGMSLAPGEGIAGQVVENGQAVIIKNCQADKRWASRVDSKTGFQTRTMICVPLSWEGQTFGCIQIINQLNDLFFDDKDLSFAESLAKEIAALFHEEGMLRGYIAEESAKTPKKAPKWAAKWLTKDSDVSFQSVFCQGNDREMERRLRGVQEFVALSDQDQQEVLRLCKQLRSYFGKRSG